MRFVAIRIAPLVLAAAAGGGDAASTLLDVPAVISGVASAIADHIEDKQAAFMTQP